MGVFPNRAAIARLVGAVLVEQDAEWAVSRRYTSLASIGQVLKRTNPFPTNPTPPVAA